MMRVLRGLLPALLLCLTLCIPAMAQNAPAPPAPPGAHDDRPPTVCTRGPERSTRRRRRDTARRRASATAHAQQRRHRVDADQHGTRADDDHPGPGALLRRHGAQEERARHHDAVLRHHGDRHRRLVRHRLQPRLHQRRGCDRPLHRWLEPASSCAASRTLGTSRSRSAPASTARPRRPSQSPSTSCSR